METTFYFIGRYSHEGYSFIGRFTYLVLQQIPSVIHPFPSHIILRNGLNRNVLRTFFRSIISPDQAQRIILTVNGEIIGPILIKYRKSNRYILISDVIYGIRVCHQVLCSFHGHTLETSLWFINKCIIYLRICGQNPFPIHVRMKWCSPLSICALMPNSFLEGSYVVHCDR